MTQRDPRVDAYIAAHAAFAPLLTHLRELVHEVCPDVQESIKWGMPAFDYQGPLCNLAAFKAHCAFSLWKGALIVDSSGGSAAEAMGQFGRLTSLADLPGKAALVRCLKQAMKLNVDGVKLPQRSRKIAKPAPVVPDDLSAALRGNRKAQQAFAAFSPGKQREYVEWLDEAKQAATRQKRLLQAVEWIAEGKARNWKYEVRPTGAASRSTQ